MQRTVPTFVRRTVNNVNQDTEWNREPQEYKAEVLQYLSSLFCKFNNHRRCVALNQGITDESHRLEKIIRGNFEKLTEVTKILESELLLW